MVQYLVAKPLTACHIGLDKHLMMELWHAGWALFTVTRSKVPLCLLLFFLNWQRWRPEKHDSALICTVCVCVCWRLFVFSSLVEQLQQYHLYTTRTHTHQMPTLLLQQTVDIFFGICPIYYFLLGTLFPEQLSALLLHEVLLFKPN